HAERGEEPRRHRAEASVRIVLSGAELIALDRELEAGAEAARLAPGRERAQGHAVDAGESADAPDDLLVEGGDLLLAAAVLHDRYVEGEDAVDVEAGLRRLEGEEGLDDHARPHEQHERGGDLRAREQLQ